MSHMYIVACDDMFRSDSTIFRSLRLTTKVQRDGARCTKQAEGRDLWRGLVHKAVSLRVT